MNDRKLNIIMLPLARWDGPYSSTAYSLAIELSKRHRVFYLDNPFTYKDVIKNINSVQIKRRFAGFISGRKKYYKVENTPENFTAVFSRPVLPINFLPSGKLHNYLLRKNDRIISSLIAQIVKDYQLDNYILINSFNPFYGLSFKGKKPDLYIYQSVDNIAESKYVKKHGIRLELKIAAVADVTITTSSHLAKKFHTFGINATLLPNAADVNLFKSAQNELEKPLDFDSEGKKVIGYFGNLCHRLDYDLLKHLAEKHHDKLIYLVGPVSGKYLEESGLKEYKNIRLTGKKKLHQLPAYLRGFDVAIIPFKINHLTASIYPLKVNEYLAGGKPIVSTPFSEDIVSFSDVIYLAGSKEEFSQKIEMAIEENSTEKIAERVKIAEQNSWEARCIDLETLIINEAERKKVKAV